MKKRLLSILMLICVSIGCLIMYSPMKVVELFFTLQIQ